jgi:hypothetical protein
MTPIGSGSACAHEGVPAGPPWTQTEHGPYCSLCGVPWPGHQLPKPAHHAEGRGELAGMPSWRARVDAMLEGLRDVA